VAHQSQFQPQPAAPPLPPSEPGANKPPRARDSRWEPYSPCTSTPPASPGNVAPAPAPAESQQPRFWESAEPSEPIFPPEEDPESPPAPPGDPLPNGGVGFTVVEREGSEPFEQPPLPPNPLGETAQEAPPPPLPLDQAQPPEVEREGSEPFEQPPLPPNPLGETAQEAPPPPLPLDQAQPPEQYSPWPRRLASYGPAGYEELHHPFDPHGGGGQLSAAVESPLPWHSQKQSFQSPVSSWKACPWTNPVGSFGAVSGQSESQVQIHIPPPPRVNYPLLGCCCFTPLLTS